MAVVDNALCQADERFALESDVPGSDRRASGHNELREKLPGHQEAVPLESYWSTASPRAVFISDLHLGCKYARAEECLQFLDGCEPDFLYLVGDIVDGWRLRRIWRWYEVYDKLLCRFIAMSRKGTLVRFTPGNHDRFLRSYLTSIGRIELADEFLHVTADGRRFLVTHGDRFDWFETGPWWISVIATFGYDALLNTNRLLNVIRRRPGDFSLSAAVKKIVKAFVGYVSSFEDQLEGEARRRRCDGIVCGHVHEPIRRHLGKVTYLNTGDWIENCTALVEHRCGTLELVAVNRSRVTTLARVEPEPTTLPADDQQIGIPQVGDREMHDLMSNQQLLDHWGAMIEETEAP